MTTEYIRLTSPEIVYGKKGLLEAQLNLLNATRHEYEYKKLRKEECMLKIALKKATDETLVSLNLFASFLPKTTIKEEKHHHAKKEIISTPVMDNKSLSLDQEIENIKQKLAALR
ncbi:MAG: hypothetical protein AABY00_04045 [Nanoarchaeota archaeon]